MRFIFIDDETNEIKYDKDHGDAWTIDSTIPYDMGVQTHRETSKDVTKIWIIKK